MTETGTVQVEDHQFLITAADADTTDVTAEGTLIWTGPGFVSVLAGISHGPVTLTVDLTGTFDTALDSWEAVEEAVVEAGTALHLMTLGGNLAEPFSPIPAGRYTIRVHACGRDTHFDLGVTEPVETYLIQLGPTTTPPAGITCLRRTDSAHGATEVPTDRRPKTDDRVNIPGENGTWIKVDRDSPRAHEVYEYRAQFGPRPPSEWLTADPGRRLTASYVAYMDRDLVDDIAALTADQQRALARWTTRRAFERAGLAEHPDFRAALDAMDNATPPPPKFTVPSLISNWMDTDPSITFTVAPGFGGQTDSCPQSDAIATYLYTVGDETDIESPTAAFEAIRWASRAYGHDYPELITAIREEFFPRT
ncbi:hypothetical protein ACFC06_25160 [Nocardia sp. NPDC056064]|uniref:hypothetical protein n=1 Tax=Nocardia sp. NPDC056064 TaxID=3345701 RepID=UPI0035E32C8A